MGKDYVLVRGKFFIFSFLFSYLTNMLNMLLNGKGTHFGYNLFNVPRNSEELPGENF